MVQFIQEGPSRSQLLSEQLGSGLGQGIGNSLQTFFQNKQNTQEGSALATALGKPELGPMLGKLGPELTKLVIDQYGADALAEGLGRISGLPANNPPTQAEKSLAQGPAAQPIPGEKGPAQSQQRATALSDSEFQQIYNRTPAKQRPQLIKERRAQQQLEEQKRQSGLKDTSKYRQELATEAKASEKSIQSKENLIKIIEKGNLSHPLVAGVAKFLPQGFREGLLSNDSLKYEAGLFDEFGVLKGMFPGQIRTAEINLLEPKLASLYKNDKAKKEILSAGIEAARANVIRSKAAAQVEKEHPELSLLAFQDEVEKRSAPELQRLWDKVENDLNAIADKYSEVVTVYDGSGKAVGTVNKKDAKSLPKGYSIR